MIDLKAIMNYVDQFYQFDNVGVNRDPRDVGNGDRFYLYGIPATEAEDDDLAPRPSRPRSVLGATAATGRTSEAAPIVIRRGVLDTEEKENAFESNRGEPDGDRLGWPLSIRLGMDGAAVKFGYMLSITNFNRFFVNVRFTGTRIVTEMQRQLPEDTPANLGTKRMLVRLLGGIDIPQPDRHFLQLQMDWHCRSTNRWSYAGRNAAGTPGVIHVTSGAFRPVTTRQDVEEAIRALLNQLAEFYDFGADVPQGYAGSEESASVIQVVRNENGLPMGLRIVDDPAINNFQFLCNLTVYMIRPAQPVPAPPAPQQRPGMMRRAVERRERNRAGPAPRPAAVVAAAIARRPAPAPAPARDVPEATAPPQFRYINLEDGSMIRNPNYVFNPANPSEYSVYNVRSRREARPPRRSYYDGTDDFFGCYKQPETAEEKRLHALLSKKHSVVMVKNSDESCFARCLAVLLTKAYCIQKQGASSTEKSGSTRVSAETCDALDAVFQLLDDSLRRKYRHIGDMHQQAVTSNRIQGDIAKAICDLCEHDFDVAVMPLDMELFSQRLGLTIRIIDSDGFQKVYEVGQHESICYLLKVGQHFHALRSYRGLLGNHYECLDCDIVYSKPDDHRSCPYRCFYCHARPCPGGPTEAKKRKAQIHCDSCLRDFPNDDCFREHLERTCKIWRVCGVSGCKPFKRADYDDLSEHKCGDTKCYNCKKMCPVRHKCFFQTKKAKEPVDRLAFFDFECAQETGVHKVTHVVLRVEKSGQNQVFVPDSTGCFENVLSRFCEYIFSPERFKNYTFIAHNGQGYDFQFILQWCLNANKPPVNVVRAGQKIKHMIVDGVRFIDSLSFLLMPLSAFPKTFGFDEKVKGYFPHMFNTAENQLYSGVMPPREAYVPEEMSIQAKKVFDKWYDEHAGDHFVFQCEILKYCISDVDILQTGCLRFQSIFSELTGVDPFSYMTIAGACLAVYRSGFNVGETIMTMLPEDAKFVRRGFFGGRTCVMQAHVKLENPDESIRYVDVTSLYPWVNTFCEYPMGDYERVDISKNPACDTFEIDTIVESVFGFLEIDLLCPDDLLLPVIPEKKDFGLKFDLVPKTKIVVSSIELKKALTLGYKVTKIYGYIHWPETTCTLFKEYMLTFLKVKQEASGWSGKMLNGVQVETDEEKDAWIAKYHEEEGVLLEKDRVQLNPGMRAISKLCLNSLWGKMGQRPEHRQVFYTPKASDVLEYLRRYTVHEITDVGTGDMHEVVYSTDRAEKQPAFGTCVALAAITTAHARMRLYSGLETVGDRAIYCDTDSIVYVSKPGLPDIPIGDKLGEWTDELGGDYIQEFVATGPKSYAYITRSGKSAIKCKGFKMSYINCKTVLNFENYKAAVTGEDFETETVTLHRIERDKATKSVVTENNACKYFVPTLDRKGVVDANSSTLRIYPFGYNTEHNK